MSNETGFERRARELLRGSAEGIDGATRSRLTQARHAALSELERPAGWRSLQVLAPGGAVAAAVLVAVLLWATKPETPGNGGALDDIELLADAEGYELSQEPDLDFIEWAAAMGERGPTGT